MKYKEMRYLIPSLENIGGVIGVTVLGIIGSGIGIGLLSITKEENLKEETKKNLKIAGGILLGLGGIPTIIGLLMSGYLICIGMFHINPLFFLE